MTVAFVDSTIFVHFFRKNPDAQKWLKAQEVILSISPITWMEIMVGVANKQAQGDSLALLNGFEMVYLTAQDMNWAMQQMVDQLFSRGVKIMDCFNASVCHRLNVPIYTHNVKDYLKVLPSSLVIKPY